MNIQVREISDGRGFAEISIEEYGTKIELGFLNQSERLSLAKIFMSAAMDLLEKVRVLG